MANCTNIGQPGTSIPLTDNPLPSGVICNLSGYGQSAANQTAQVKDKNNNVVAQIVYQGQAGGPIKPMTPPSGSTSFFTANNGPYTVSITNSGSQTSQVIKSYAVVSAGTTTYTGNWLFIAEDSPNGGDCDFNDCTVFLSWNLRAG
jgi:hypothetical protein